ncbi:hypothetical protein AB1Y20_000860 [Prymnesium parvum]|uniref:RING-type E3 ubiquitin transferase n=1 Tax=Prymnesium parvum TaxID=97485 RepID=A0AB34K9D0_PRYPA
MSDEPRRDPPLTSHLPSHGHDAPHVASEAKRKQRLSSFHEASRLGQQALEYPPHGTEEGLTRWGYDRRRRPPSEVVLKPFQGRATIATPHALRQTSSPRAPREHPLVHPLVSPRRQAAKGSGAPRRADPGLPLLAVKSGLSESGRLWPEPPPPDPDIGGVEVVAQRSVIDSWVAAFDRDQESWASRALFVELRLRQALASSSLLGVPNIFRCAIVCDCWERVAPMTGAYAPVLGLLWCEILRCIFSDFSVDMAGGGANQYAAATPYFVEVKRLRRHDAEMQEKMHQWQMERDSAKRLVEERNKVINQTLAAWHEKMTSVTSSSKASKLEDDMNEMVSSLHEANRQVEELSKQKIGDPMQMCIEFFEQLPLPRQEETLRSLLCSEAATSVLPRKATSGSMAPAAELLAPMLGELSVPEFEELVERLLVSDGSGERRLKVLKAMLLKLASGAKTPSEAEECGELAAVTINMVKDAAIARLVHGLDKRASSALLLAEREESGYAGDAGAPPRQLGRQRTVRREVDEQLRELSLKCSRLEEQQSLALEQLQYAEVREEHLLEQVDGLRGQLREFETFRELWQAQARATERSVKAMQSERQAAHAALLGDRNLKIAENEAIMQNLLGRIADLEDEAQLTASQLMHAEDRAEAERGRAAKAVASLDAVKAERNAETKRRMEAERQVLLAQMEANRKVASATAYHSATASWKVEMERMQKASAIQSAAERATEMRRVILELEERVRRKESELNERQRLFDVRLANEQALNAERVEIQRKRDEGYSNYKVLVERRKAAAALMAEKDKIKEQEAMLIDMEDRLRSNEDELRELNNLISVLKSDLAAATSRSKSLNERLEAMSENVHLANEKLSESLTQNEALILELSRNNDEREALEQQVKVLRDGERNMHEMLEKERKEAQAAAKAKISAVASVRMEMEKQMSDRVALERARSTKQFELEKEAILANHEKENAVQDRTLAERTSEMAATLRANLQAELERVRRDYALAKASAAQVAELRVLQDPRAKSVRDVGVQAGPSRVGDKKTSIIADIDFKREDVEESEDASRQEEDEDSTEELPASVATPLATIRFGKKGVRPMNALMCRKLIATFYLVKLESPDDVRQRQELRDFVPDQMLVLYGVKKLAARHLLEFLYGTRAHRYRAGPGKKKEPEPQIHFFWRACQLGVPREMWIVKEDFNFYVELVGAVATCVGNDHTLQTKTTSFWAIFGTLVELEVPCFILSAALRRLVAKKVPSLYQRLVDAFAPVAKQETAQVKEKSKPRKPSTGYRVQTLLPQDQGGHVLLDSFLLFCVEVHAAHRTEEAAKLNEIYCSWDPCGDSSYDSFSEMIRYSKPDVSDAMVINLYKMALDDETDAINMDNAVDDSQPNDEHAEREVNSEEESMPTMSRRETTTPKLLGQSFRRVSTIQAVLQAQGWDVDADEDNQYALSTNKEEQVVSDSLDNAHPSDDAPIPRRVFSFKRGVSFSDALVSPEEHTPPPALPRNSVAPSLPSGRRSGSSAEHATSWRSSGQDLLSSGRHDDLAGIDEASPM